MGGLLTYLLGGKKDENKTPIENASQRIKNLLKVHYRGLLGLVGFIIITAIMFRGHDPPRNTKYIWLVMTWFLLVHPMHHAAVGLIALAFLPLLGCGYGVKKMLYHIFNHGIMFFVVGSYHVKLFNCSGLDKRIALTVLSFKRDRDVTASSLVVRASIASFLLGAFSCKLMSTEVMMKTLVPALGNLASSVKGSKDKNEVNYNRLKYQVCNAICSSMCIGGSVFIHSSLNVMGFKALYIGHGLYHADTFNFLAYSSFAAPFCIVAFIVNLVINIIITKMNIKGNMSPVSKSSLVAALRREREKIPKSMTCHELLSLVLMLLLLVAYFTRWNKFFGWSRFQQMPTFGDRGGIPSIQDVSVAALFLQIACNIPISYNWVTKLINRDTSPGKVPSSVLFWRLVDKSTPYAYALLLCGAICLCQSIHMHLRAEMVEIGSFITNLDWNIGVLLIILMAAFLCNIMTSIGALVVLESFVLHIVDYKKLFLNDDMKSVWEKRIHLAALGVGIACSFGFCAQFRNTPSYFSYKIAKVPLIRQVKSGIASVIGCTIILYVFIAFLSPILVFERADIYYMNMTASEAETTINAAPED